MKPKARMFAVVVVFSAFVVLPALDQQCPKEVKDGPSQPSEARTLEGQLIYHDGLRKWFELKLDEPECGQQSVQLIAAHIARAPVNPASLETLRGCRVRTEGLLDLAHTGYYMLDVAQYFAKIEPVSECTRQPPFPDYSRVRPSKSLRDYRVEITIDYEQADTPIFFHVTSGGDELRPWQAYARYSLTGEYALYGYCAKGFIVDEVFGDAEAAPQHFDERGDLSDAAMFDPEGPAVAGKKELQLGYTCVRGR